VRLPVKTIAERNIDAGFFAVRKQSVFAQCIGSE
jgi:hypothetical protein